jgi:tetratricopeptide (TPR) repeat protein
MQCAQVYNNLGMVYAEQRDWTKAEESYEKSLEIKRQVGDSLGQARTLVNLVQVYRGRTQLGAAIEASTRAIQLFAAVRHTIGLARAKRTLGRLYVEHGAPLEARGALQEATELFARAGAESEARETQREFASIGRDVGLPWWAWLMIAFWGLLVVSLIILVIALGW